MSGTNSPDQLIDALAQAKTHLDTAIGHMTTGAAASGLSQAQLSRLRALSDQNTSCQNSGCGGAEASKAQAVNPAALAQR